MTFRYDNYDTNGCFRYRQQNWVQTLSVFGNVNILIKTKWVKFDTIYRLELRLFKMILKTLNRQKRLQLNLLMRGSFVMSEHLFSSRMFSLCNFHLSATFCLPWSALFHSETGQTNKTYVTELSLIKKLL